MKRMFKILVSIIASFMLISFINVNDVVNAQVKSNVQEREVSEKTSQESGRTIAEIFPDENLAKVVVKYSGAEDVNTVLTQEMIDKVTVLGASSKNISDLTGIGVLTNLRTVSFANNNISYIPEEIGVLTNLISVSFANNNISYIPEEIGNLQKVESLYLNKNKLTTVPDVITTMSSLQILSLTNNQITSISENIGDLTNLVNFEIYNNYIEELPESFTELKNLKSFDCKNNNIDTLPEDIGKLSNLFILRANGNNISTIPESIGELVGLHYLSMANNKIEYLPESISNLVNMKDIDFNDNLITKLPDGIGNMTKLYLINFENNQIANVPENIIKINTEVPGLVTESFENNLLPTDYHETINELVDKTTYNYTQQRRLELKSNDIEYNISSKADFDAIDLSKIVMLSDGSDVSTQHEFKLDNFVDENGVSVNIDDYLSNNNRSLTKTGTVYANVKIDSTGLLSTDNENALTTNAVRIEFKKPSFNLSFDLNGGEGIAPADQVLSEGEITKVVENPVRTGYIFKGWNTKNDGTGESWVLGETLMGTTPTKLFAIWEVVEPVTNQELPKTGSENITLSLIALISLLALSRFKIK